MQSETLSSLPYLVHTNRELGLMIRGTKPLAVFRWVEGYQLDFVARYLRMFDRHVAGGQFGKREIIRPAPQLPYLLDFQIFYTLPGQDWRVEAYLDLHDLPGRWTAVRERRLGELLGYEDWQNDFWLETFKQAD